MNLLLQKYRILGKKGEGTFSEVLKCQRINDGSYWACKKMKQTYDSLEQVNNLREVQAMRRLSPHSNILELQEVIFDKKSGTLVLICELMDMNIYELIRGKHHYLPEQTVKTYMYQLCKSIEHIHRNGIFHRDVKPENILIKEDLLKLADFGSCRSVYSKQPYTEYISTRWYRAPECLLTDGYYSFKMDMWSAGCVFFEVLSLRPLFPGSNEVDQIAKIHDVVGTPDPGVLNKLKKSRGMNFNFPSKKGCGVERMLSHVSSDAIDLIYQMCTYDPDERISAKQAIRHPYFKEYREADKRAIAHAKVKHEDVDDGDTKFFRKKVDITNPKRSPEVIKDLYTSKSERKVPDPELALIASHPKAQALPSHPPIFKDKKRRRHRHLLDNGQFISQTGFLPKVPMHTSTINPSFQASSFPSFKHIHNANSLSLLPSINNSYKNHQKASSKMNKNMFGHSRYLPSLDRRGKGF